MTSYHIGLNTENPATLTISPVPQDDFIEIWLTDDTVLMTWREKPFTWWQRAILQWCFGWKEKAR